MFLAQKAEIKRITLADLMAYPPFVDFVNYRVTIRLNAKYEARYEAFGDDAEFTAYLAKQEELRKSICEADEFLIQYYEEIKGRLDFFRVYDMKKEDVDLDTLNTLQVVSAINHCVKLLENESEPQQKNHQSSNIPSMIAAQNKKLRQELLAKIKVITPKQFEELSVLILGHLLYEGQPLSEFKKHIKQQGQSGDGGIDGIVTKYDRIRGNVIHYVQSKRYTTNSVQRPEVQSFVGALDPHRAKIGVFITTSRFTEGAKEYVKSLNLYDVRLVDGFELVEMMIECGIGVKKVADISLMEINNTFFDTEASLLAV
jgi:restriction endonuclease Mrr